MEVSDQVARDRRRRIVPLRQSHLFGETPTLGLWKRWRPARRFRGRRMSAAEIRLEAARRDPRQVSIFGLGHTEELTGEF